VLARVDDPLIETTTTLAAAYGSFLVAEEFGLIFNIEDLHFSGILAVVATGLVVGTQGLINTSPTTRITLEYFWEVLAFLVNSLVFLVIGLKINLREIDFAENAVNVLVAIAAILLTRLIIVYGFGAVHARLQSSRRIPVPFRHVMYWGGLRGAISLALALFLEESDFSPEVVDTLLVMTFGVVLFTLLVQGTTISGLIKKLGLSGIADNERHQQEIQARIYAARAGQAEIARIGEEGVLFSSMSKAMQETYDRDVQQARAELHEHFADHPELEVSMLLQARRDALVAEQSAIGEMVRTGLVSTDVGHHLGVELNNRLAALDLIEERWETDVAPPGESNN
jgi:CPA1 family monovalent cation:H+ antiporter